MSSERGPQYVSLLLVRSEPFQLFRGAATAVIEQDCGEWAAALRAPDQRVQRDRPVVHCDGFRAAGRLSLGGCRKRRGQDECGQKENPRLRHLAPALLLAQSGCRCLAPDTTTPQNSGSVYRRVCSGRLMSKPRVARVGKGLPTTGKVIGEMS